MQQGSLLPFIRDAERHVQALLGKTGADLIAAARAIVSHDLAMLAYGYRPKVTMHCAAITAAELLCLAAQLERSGGGPPQEARPLGHALMPAAADRRQPSSAQALERDANALGALLKTLTQADVARALADFRQAATERGIDLVMSLALELKGERVRDVARRHQALDAPGAAAWLRRQHDSITVPDRSGAARAQGHGVAIPAIDLATDGDQHEYPFPLPGHADHGHAVCAAGGR